MTQPLEDPLSLAPSIDEELRGVVGGVAGSVVFNDEEQRRFAQNLLAFGLDRYNRRRRKPVAPEAQDASTDRRKRGRRTHASPASFPHFAIVSIWAFAKWGNQNTGIADYLVILVTNELSFRRPMDAFFRGSEHESKWHDTLCEIVKSTTLTPLGEDLSNRVRSQNSVYHFLREYRLALESSQLPEQTKKRSMAVLAGVISGAIIYLFGRIPKAISGTTRSALSTTTGKIGGLFLIGLGAWAAYSFTCEPRSERPIVSAEGSDKKDEEGERSTEGVRPSPPLATANTANSTIPRSQPALPEMQEPQVPQNQNDGGTSLPHDGQQRIPPTAADGENPGKNPKVTQTPPVEPRSHGLRACDLKSIADKARGPDVQDCGGIDNNLISKDALTLTREQTCALSRYQSGSKFLLRVQYHSRPDDFREDLFVAHGVAGGFKIDQYRLNTYTDVITRTECSVPLDSVTDWTSRGCLRGEDGGVGQQICPLPGKHEKRE